MMSFFERKIVGISSYLLTRKVAFRLAKYMLATQGIGWAGPAGGVESSGESKFLVHFLKNNADPCIFDVGANIGDYSSHVLIANSNSIIYCFEPSVAHYKVLKKKFANFAKVTLVNLALSSSNQQLKLYKDKEISGLATLVKRNLDHAKIFMTKSENIKTMQGDLFIKKNKITKIDLLKIDVEGWEMEVLRGLEMSFSKKIIKACQFEFGHAHIEKKLNFRDFYIFFKERGYKFGSIMPNGKINHINFYDEIYENYYATNYIAFI